MTKEDAKDTIEEFKSDMERMIDLYNSSKYTQAEATKDDLRERLDDIMRIGGHFNQEQLQD